jgi:hypothetical protein
MPHIEQLACYKTNNMPNFRLLFETKYDETKYDETINEHAFHQIEDEKNEHDVCIL